ncbi:predicted protein [Pyrenophora tritici-repentis Pt-1C-BFP]|uniref:Uncharacterized protein n=1 Tax=Pyrenophora tritici-repentis (strain Pt-1C-BFP) TaxID=426418 RepID=B2W9M5_PYRTR|nr:uncharacterized protein PTRG_06683 [Pyrenophora tritici-repentis Pt-1C-BFP]EDU49603.1 predicted protein [Pyrenophora tritici-repentis Pt-1C-BFP]
MAVVLSVPNRLHPEGGPWVCEPLCERLTPSGSSSYSSDSNVSPEVGAEVDSEVEAEVKSSLELAPWSLHVCVFEYVAERV